MVHICALTPSPILILQKRHGAAKEDGKLVYNDLEDGAKYCERLGVDVTGCMMDNPNTSKAAGDLWRDKRKTGAPGCAAHGDSLLSDDLYKTHANDLKSAKRLSMRLRKSKMGDFVKEYKIERIIKDKLAKSFEPDKANMDNKEYRDEFYKIKNKNNRRIGKGKGESITRGWCSNYNILSDLIKNKKEIKRLTAEDQMDRTGDYLLYKSKKDDEQDIDFEDMIDDNDQWKRWEDILNELRAMKYQLTISQGDLFSLSDVFHQYNILGKHYPQHQDKITKRWNLIVDAQHSAAYYSDPRYVLINKTKKKKDELNKNKKKKKKKGRNRNKNKKNEINDLNDDEKEKDKENKQKNYKLDAVQNDEFLEEAMEYLCQQFGREKWIDGGYKDLFIQFRTQTGKFKKYKYLKPEDGMEASIDWWKGFSVYAQFEDFAKGMIKICSCVGNNGQLERSFNHIRRLHTPQRGALGPKTVDKMVYVSANVNFLKREIYEHLGMKSAIDRLDYAEKLKDIKEKELSEQEANQQLQDIMDELGGDYDLFDAGDVDQNQDKDNDENESLSEEDDSDSDKDKSDEGDQDTDDEEEEEDDDNDIDP